MFKNFKIRDYDFKLVLMVLALSIIGVFAIGSAEESLQLRQLAGVIVGVILMLVISFCNYSLILKLYWGLYIVNLILLVMVQVMGETNNTGAQRWLKIGGLKLPKYC